MVAIRTEGREWESTHYKLINVHLHPKKDYVIGFTELERYSYHNVEDMKECIIEHYHDVEEAFGRPVIDLEKYPPYLRGVDILMAKKPRLVKETMYDIKTSVD